MLLEFSNSAMLTDEMLSTLFCEVEYSLNSRPLTSVTADVDDLRSISPNQLLTLHADVQLPPCVSNVNTSYPQKRWRQIQYLADLFWTRWRREYLPGLLQRQKWTLKRRQHEVGDLVLVVDQLLPRNMWCVGRITKIRVSEDGNIRSARVKVAKRKMDGKIIVDTSFLERPISKLILLMAVEEPTNLT